jgi:hypothetical protein
MRIWGGKMELLRSLTISDLEPFLADPTQLNTQSIALQLAVNGKVVIGWNVTQ